MQTDVARDQSFLDQAISVAVANVAEGGGPFGAVVVGPDGGVLATGSNRVTAIPDPTAHAEIVAIRRACEAVQDFALRGHTLYASCEPCPLCLSASLWARLDRVVFAADRHAAEAAGFSDRDFHELFSVRRDVPWPLELQHQPHPGSERPFDAWRGHQERTDY